jgi:hypothetical protein
MATFLSFNNRLPDPTFGVNDAGVVDAAGLTGPGFASVRMSDSEETQVSRTRSGRGVHRSDGNQYWTISIKYNPMTRDEFDVVDAFLQARNGRRNPFFVVLPQYSKSKNSVFAALAAGTPLYTVGSTAAGSNTITIDGGGATVNSYPKPGDFFNISDGSDINHLKAYKITRVETPAYYQTGTTAPPADSFRVHTNPPMQRFVTDNALVIFVDPMFRVMLRGDVLEHELDTENTFEFGLELEEILP